MKLINNFFNDTRKIEGFTKEEILAIKNQLHEFRTEKKDSKDIEDYLKDIFHPEILEFYSNYLFEIQKFSDEYFITKKESEPKDLVNLYYLKFGILNEITSLSKNLLNLKLNIRNTKSFLKNNVFLNDFIATVQNLLDESKDLIFIIERSLHKIDKIYDNIVYLWIETSKIKNFNFKINKNFSTLENWDEIKGFYRFIENSNKLPTQKKKKKKKKELLTSHFQDIYDYFLKIQDDNINFSSDLIYLLHQNKIFEEHETEEFVNILERKEIIQKLKNFMHLIIKTLLEDQLKDILEEIIKLDEEFKLENDGGNINLKSLLEQKISIFLPKIINYYLNGLEKKYKRITNDLVESDEIKNIISFYSEKIELFSTIIVRITKQVDDFEQYLKPYENITDSLKKTFFSLNSEILRRKTEYLYYLKTIKNEKIRDNIRKYISEKISETNKLINTYQDDTSIILREEFPQLKKIGEILNEYKLKINEIKGDVCKKLESFKEKDVDIYQIIKQWEDNFNRKRQQLSFLFSLILNKTFKSFKDLIEDEESLFDNISEITKITEYDTDPEVLPLNFTMAKILADKLTENELKERITELNSKINKLTTITGLYQEELTKLEEIFSTRVKIREGILISDVQCVICHEFINFTKEKIIKCPFCGAVYHYLCVAFWLSKYNSCPNCQNKFLDPNSGLFENSEND
ncbi:MAG: hypothetical protein ACTSUT_14785 [Promethearchaeota archaeon]